MKLFFSRMAVVLLYVCASVVVLLYIVNRWFHPLYTNTDVWVERTAPVIKIPVVQTALSRTLSQRIMKEIPLDQTFSVLPPQARFLETPLRGLVEESVQKFIGRAVQSPQIEAAWKIINRALHQQFRAAVDGKLALNRPTELNLRSLLPNAATLATQQVIVRFDLQQYGPFLRLLGRISLKVEQLIVPLIALFTFGIALSRRRSSGIIGVGIALLATSASMKIALSVGIAQVGPVAQAVMNELLKPLVVDIQSLAVIGSLITIGGVLSSWIPFANILPARFSTPVKKVRTVVTERKGGLIIIGFAFSVLIILLTNLLPIYGISALLFWVSAVLFTAEKQKS